MSKPKGKDDQEEEKAQEKGNSCALAEFQSPPRL